jgi:signal transduction histidine kinase
MAEPVPLTRAVPTRGALIDLIVVAAFVWMAVFVIHRFDIPEALAHWNAVNEQWAIDEVTMVSLCVTAGMGVFAWRRWQESLATVARHEATLQRLHTTESEIESKDRLIRSVSHELRTPLTALLGFAELLAGPSIDAAERRTAVQTIVSQGRDLSNIVDDLLTRAQVEASTLRLARVSLSLGAQAAQVVEAWGSDGADRIHTSADREVRGWGDPARVRQIIRNLISNGLKYGDGTVEISTSSSGETAYIAVVNPGQSIPPEHRARIFDPYHRATRDDRNPGGLGLGLAISLQLARLMGGDLTYTPGQGTSIFELSLPCFLGGVPTPVPEVEVLTV